MNRSVDCVAPLFVPGDRSERFEKAAASGADAIIIDLEDAVAPAAKDAARTALRTDFTALPVLVRINAAGTPWHADDLAAVAKLTLAAIVVPKAELDAAGLEAVAIASSSCPVIALVESARGLAQAQQIASLPGVARLAFGSIDFCADLGCAHTREALLMARSELVLASRLAGKAAPIDGVTTTIDDRKLVFDDTAHAQALGFGGKLCIHPRQIEPVLAGFRPSAVEVAWARKVVASGDGAASVDGAMVDEPVRIRARTILAREGGVPSSR